MGVMGVTGVMGGETLKTPHASSNMTLYLLLKTPKDGKHRVECVQKFNKESQTMKLQKKKGGGF